MRGKYPVDLGHCGWRHAEGLRLSSSALMIWNLEFFLARSWLDVVTNHDLDGAMVLTHVGESEHELCCCYLGLMCRG
jgi:hypothetical protein